MSFPEHDPEFDTPALPMSAFKWIRPSTLPLVPCPNPAHRYPRPPEHATFASSNPLPRQKEFTLFPVTPAFLADMAKDADKQSQPAEHHGHKGMIDREPAAKARGRIKKDRGRQAVEYAEVQPMPSGASHGPAKPRRSPRIATLNARKAAQTTLAPFNQGNKVAKRSEKPPMRTQRKIIANREEEVAKKPRGRPKKIRREDLE